MSHHPEAIVLSSELADALAEGCSADGYEHVADNQQSTSRWYRNMVLVIRRVSDGKLFGCDYELGLTENQDPHLPWSDGYEVEFDEMSAETVQRIVYRYRHTSDPAPGS